MHFPRRKATVQTSDPMAASDGEELSTNNRVVEISIVAAIAIALGLSGPLSAVITYKDDLARDRLSA